MMKTRCPKRLCDDCLELMADVNSHSVQDNHGLNGQTPQAIITGETQDISRFAEFSFYQWFKWFDQEAVMPDDQEKYERYLGPSRDAGSLMASKILSDKGKILSIVRL
jgi:hypothetical protein